MTNFHLASPAIIVALILPTFANGQSSVISSSDSAIHGSTVIDASPQNNPRQFPISSMNERQQRWEQILDRTFPTEFEGLDRCDKIILQLRRLGLPIVLDVSASDDSLTLPDPLVLPLPDEPLRDRLQLALSSANATLAIIGNRLAIISIDVSYEPEYFLTVAYDLSDLNIATMELMEKIKSAIAPEDWEDSGGYSTLETLIVNGRRAITLSGPYSTHRQLVEYLRGLKKIQGNVPQNRDLIVTSPLTSSRVIELPGQSQLERQKRGGMGGGGIGGYGLGGGVF